MAIVTCAICGQEVSKGKSLAIGDGKRACRTHSETGEMSQKVQEERKLQDEKGRQRKVSPKLESPKCESGKFQCMICGQEGMRQTEYFYNLCVANAKYKTIYGRYPNIFDADEVRKSASSLMGIRCLLYVRWEANSHIKVPFRAYQAATLTGVLLVCGECCVKKGFKSAMDEQMENTSFDDLLKISTILEPVIDMAAKKEMAASN